MTEPILRVAVSFPPPACVIWRRWDGAAYMTRAGHRYMDITAARIRQAMLTNAVSFRHGVHVTADIYPPDKRERNIDSVARILTDSIRQMGWQIPDVVTAVRQPRPRQGGCVLYFWE